MAEHGANTDHGKTWQSLLKILAVVGNPERAI